MTQKNETRSWRERARVTLAICSQQRHSVCRRAQEDEAARSRWSMCILTAIAGRASV
jgi:hypothetical protein